MPANPLVDQGTLNRIRGSLSWINFPGLNVTASFLGPDGIRMALEGGASTMLPTLTGVVQSPEPYMMVNVTIHLIKSQPLAALYKTRMEDLAIMGEFVVRPDVTTLPPYDFQNGALENVREMGMNGRDHEFVISIRGQYLINNQLWNL